MSLNQIQNPRLEGQRNYDGYPLRLIAYISLTLVLYSTFEIFNASLNYIRLDYPTMHLRRLADALFLSLPVWFFTKNWIIFLWIGLIELNLNANLIYYGYYSSLIPFSSFRLVNQVFELGDSILVGIGWANLALIILPLLWCVWYGVCKIGKKIKYKAHQDRKRTLISACCSFCIGIGIILPSYLIGNPDDYSRPKGLFRNEPLRAFQQFGWINYWIYQFSNLQGVSKDESNFAHRELSQLQNEWKTIKPLTSHQNKNLILILVESLGSWPIGLEVNGEKVTPRLDQLIADTTSVYIQKMLPQVKHGRSSDAYLMINTGLLPINEGAASCLYATNDYPSLPKALKAKGYRSFSFICGEKEYWNQETSSKSYGFERVYDKLDGGESDLADGNLFSKGFPIVKSFKEPFYAQLVTMSGHDPVRNKLKSKFHNMDFATDEARNIVAIVNYTDSCIGAFIDNLKKCGIYDRSIIVITGDHDGVGSDKFDGRKKTELTDRYIPFLIVNVPKGLNADTTLISAQSDIFPSLLDVMGIEDNKWRGLGESIFRPREDGAIYRDMEQIGSMSGETAERRRQMWKLSDILIRMGWFGD